MQCLTALTGCAPSSATSARLRATAATSAWTSQRRRASCRRARGSFSETRSRVLWLPTVVYPKPIGGVAPDGGFKGAIDVRGDGFDRAWLPIFVSGNFIAGFKLPLSEAGAETETSKQFTIIA